jgi:hypothetical protein
MGAQHFYHNHLQIGMCTMPASVGHLPALNSHIRLALAPSLLQIDFGIPSVLLFSTGPDSWGTNFPHRGS